MRCSACHENVTPVPPRTMAKVALVAFYVASLAVSMVFSCLLGLNLLLVPVAMAIGLSVGTAAQRASTWSCPECKEEMAPPVATTTPAREPERTAPARPLVPRTV